ncbi:hypothetical protein SKAU_G00279480 [Synaphobranchus kaupii]|uniref:Uncharacterized protein n=1 Tax=Synaphobranchus kaupii TaxID=118154 RepID=A0A9Q1EWU5_SYNKA|nr:hypothetical protein SKAU_G00279480 [Synaphobranchus kaupii]
MAEVILEELDTELDDVKFFSDSKIPCHHIGTSMSKSIIKVGTSLKELAPVKQFRSDCRTNFVGACKELQIDPKGCNDKRVESYLTEQGCTWQFNPPHASHMGGS